MHQGTRRIAVHCLCPHGRSVLELSWRLKGNGRYFAAPLLEQLAWRWFALAEDLEFDPLHVREGERGDLGPGARSCYQLTNS